MAERSATRTAYLEIQDELHRLGEGFRFLDEKSVLLAREMLAQLALYDAGLEDLRGLAEAALQSLLHAVERHGLDGLEVCPPADLDAVQAGRDSRAFLGLRIDQASWDNKPVAENLAPVFDSPQQRACRKAHMDYLQALFRQGVIGGNLLRLRSEYVRTERRARALDQLIMPEMRRELKHMEEQLETVDQEEAGRVRQAAQRQKAIV